MELKAQDVICHQRCYLDNSETKLVKAGPDAAMLFCSVGSHIPRRRVEPFDNHGEFFREITDADLAKTAIHTVNATVIMPAGPLITKGAPEIPVNSTQGAHEPTPGTIPGAGQQPGAPTIVDIEPETQLQDADLAPTDGSKTAAQPN